MLFIWVDAKPKADAEFDGPDEPDNEDEDDDDDDDDDDEEESSKDNVDVEDKGRSTVGS